MRILVTGGAGFIGRRIVAQLVERGHDVRVLDALHPATHAGPPDELPAEVEARWADVADGSVAAEAVAGVDAVCHQAAMVGLGVDFGDVRQYVHHNDLGTASLLEALHRREFAGRLVLASSMVVYGEGRYRCATHGSVRPAQRTVEHLEAGRYEVPCPSCDVDLEWETVDESAPADPRNVYAATKLHQEHLMEAYQREHPGTSLLSLRYHNVYGPGMPRNTPYAGVASIFRSAIARGEPPQVFEDGGQQRDFVHVDDVARANVLALESPRDARGPCNIASGTPHTIWDVAVALAEGSGIEPQVVGGHRLGDVRHVVASPNRARKVLGFEAQVPFDQGLREVANNMA